MQINGHHHKSVPPPDRTTEILVDLSGRIGRVEGVANLTAQAVHRIERHLHSPQVTSQPPRDWLTLIVGIGILASAAAGKVTWSEALPSLLGLVAR